MPNKNYSNTYDYIIVGGGIAGCSVAFELSKYTKNILLLEKNSDVALEASGAAGAFLSPLLGKPNYFKDLVNDALIFSTAFYKKFFPDFIDNCSTTRIPKDSIDKEKFLSYIPYIQFDFTEDKKVNGYNFPIASVVDSYNICKNMIKDIKTQFNYKVDSLNYKDNLWLVNNEIKTKNLILTTGYDTSLLDENYIKIRPVWGRRIDIKTSTHIDHNYHKKCSVSRSKDGVVSIGATHHRNKDDILNTSKDIEQLLQNAQEIIQLKDIEVVNELYGARAASFDYLPLVGDIINSSKTIKKYPYLKNGTKIPP
jgi:glycine/D-amino acid oxidase-like deaminating enzyme